MRYLKLFENYGTNSTPGDINLLNSYIDTINDILLELYDDRWIIDVNYLPYRWVNSGDYISVLIKKKQNKSNSWYPEESIFKISDVFLYLERIVDFFSGFDHEISICYPRTDGIVNIKQSIYTGDNYETHTQGVWTEDSNSLTIQEIDQNKEILGINIHIYLNAKNLDGFKNQNVKKY